MECHKCKEYMKHKGKNWANTPCSKCELKEDSQSTREYQENRIENSTWDANRDDDESSYVQIMDQQCPQPYAYLELEDVDQKFPISVLVSAMSLWINLSLPARTTIQMRMRNLPYSAIGKRLGITRQAAEKLVESSLSRAPLLRNLLPEKKPRVSAPFSGTRKSAVAGLGRRKSNVRK